ncbi:hypothetical protein B0O80DRAFT_460549 [Mortierella sp. GBAus27b]|nr:hypothetical protein B0O80DRAFT_460549 [Mortierella sp. GBAus27b]
MTSLAGPQVTRTQQPGKISMDHAALSKHPRRQDSWFHTERQMYLLSTALVGPFVSSPWRDLNHCPSQDSKIPEVLVHTERSLLVSSQCTTSVAPTAKIGELWKLPVSTTEFLSPRLPPNATNTVTQCSAPPLQPRKRPGSQVPDSYFAMGLSIQGTVMNAFPKNERDTAKRGNTSPVSNDRAARTCGQDGTYLVTSNIHNVEPATSAPRSPIDIVVASSKKCRQARTLDEVISDCEGERQVLPMRKRAKKKRSCGRSSPKVMAVNPSFSVSSSAEFEANLKEIEQFLEEDLWGLPPLPY